MLAADTLWGLRQPRRCRTASATGTAGYSMRSVLRCAMDEGRQARASEHCCVTSLPPYVAAERYCRPTLKPGNRAPAPTDWVPSYTAMARRLTQVKHGLNDDYAPPTRYIRMSILGKIFGKIFPSFKSDDTPVAAAPGATATGTTPATSSPTATKAMAEVDVEALLNDMAGKSAQTLNWRSSIVDLMKLLGLDSSLAERKSLATELGYTQDMNDSAAMNIWLHRQVMNKLAANGGKVPAELKD